MARTPDTVCALDLAFIQTARLTPEASAPNWNPIIPDFVAEVVSSAGPATETEEKVNMWPDTGVRLVWVAYPARREVAVYHAGQPHKVLSAADTLDGGDVVPGFTYSVGALFT